MHDRDSLALEVVKEPRGVAILFQVDETVSAWRVFRERETSALNVFQGYLKPSVARVLDERVVPFRFFDHGHQGHRDELEMLPHETLGFFVRHDVQGYPTTGDCAI